MAGTRAAMTDYIMAMAGQEAQQETQPDNTAPLAGIRVLEFCHTIMGPTAGLILADLGADVIKVEPAGGDATRRLLGFAAGFFSTFNRNKRSIAIDLKTDDGPRCFIAWRRRPTSSWKTTRPAPWIDSAAAMPIFPSSIRG